MFTSTAATREKKERHRNPVMRVVHVQASGSRGDGDGIGSLSSFPAAETRKTLPLRSSEGGTVGDSMFLFHEDGSECEDADDGEDGPAILGSLKTE